MQSAIKSCLSIAAAAAVVSGWFSYSAAAASAAFTQAATLYSKGDFAGAARAFETVVKSEPANADALYYLGLAYMQARQTAKARAAFSQVSARFAGTPTANLAAQALGNLSGGRAASSGTGSSATTASPSRDAGPSQFQVPYTTVGGQYRVRPKINGHEFEMAVDPGCDPVIIELSKVKEVGLAAPTGEATGTYTNGSKIWTTRADIALGSLVRRGVEVHIFDKSPYTTSVLGNVFFNGYKRGVNQSSGMMEMSRMAAEPARTSTASTASRASSSSAALTLPFTTDGAGHMVVQGRINGKPMRLTFNTQGNDALWITKDVAKLLNCSIDESRTVAASGAKFPCFMSSVEKAQIGNIELRDVKTVVFENSDGTWGAGNVCFNSALLRDYECSIDEAKKVIKLQKR